MAGRRARREALKRELANRGVSASKLQGKSVRELEALLRSGPAKHAGKKPPRKKPVSRKKPVARELTEEQWAEVERKTQATMAALMSDPEIAAIFAEADRMDLSVEASGGGYSEQGPRDYQEDRWFARGNLAITADGMGGHESGDEAAQITVDTIASFLPRSPDPNLLLDAVHEANKRVHQVLRGRGGCTLVTGLVSGNDLYVAHVGDARCTAVYKGRLERITRDHSIVQQMVDAGRISEEEARTHPHRNIVTRSIGSERTVQVDTKRVPLKAGMTFVFSSDGVHDYLTNPEFIRICEGSHDPKSVARRLVQKALANGSNDNCTATVLKIHPATSMYEEVGGYGMEMNPSEAEREALAHRLVEKADALLAMESPEEMDDPSGWRKSRFGKRPYDPWKSVRSAWQGYPWEGGYSPLSRRDTYDWAAFKHAYVRRLMRSMPKGWSRQRVEEQSPETRQRWAGSWALPRPTQERQYRRHQPEKPKRSAAYDRIMGARRNGRKKGGGRTQLALETPRDLREQISWRTVAEGSRPDLEEEIEWRGPTKEPFLSMWDRGWRKYKARHDWTEGPMIIHFWMGPDGSRDFLKIKDSPLERGAVPLKNPKLREFRVSSRPIMPWGGGHTAATDPTRNGWSIKKVGRAYLIAKKGDVVAASARKAGDKWDVALYWNKPSDVRRYLSTGHQFDSEGYTIEATYETVPDTPGWGLTVIDLLDRERRVLKEMD